jgi:hypothetical protein
MNINRYEALNKAPEEVKRDIAKYKKEMSEYTIGKTKPKIK